MFFLCAITLFVAPLIRGGNRQLSLIVLLALGLLLLATLGAEQTYLLLQEKKLNEHQNLTPIWRKVLFTILFLSPVWVGVLQLLPIPVDFWVQMPGRDSYLIAMQNMKLAKPNSFPLSLTPDATWASVLAGVPITAAFAAALCLPMRVVKILLALLLLAAVLQVLLSVLQLALGSGSFFYFNFEAPSGVIGSFANRNHLADFLVMAIPVCFLLFFLQTKKQKSSESLLPGVNQQVILALLLFVGFALLVILLSTLSRGGLLSGAVALGLSIGVYMLALGNKISQKQRLSYLGIAIVFVACAMFASGLGGLQARLGEHLVTDAEARNTFARSALEAAAQFWPWGSGLGSFEAVFPRFQSPLSYGYIEYAHNDYVQLLMELGFAALVVMLAFIVLFVYQIIRFIQIYRTEHRLSSNVALQCFCGISVLAFLLHSWVEFNMHIPALAITAAFLTGVFLRTPSLSGRRSV